MEESELADLDAAFEALDEDSSGSLGARAARAIRRGEEVTYSYLGVGPPPPASARRELLLRRWGFRCECELCCAELPDG